ncbi:N-acetylmuramoyl-L-alanine amidase [Clostridium botulinum]|uniref:N-acetylmuramoyl-L-alanine amidase n=1 Tax=Clostridium botulinum TaxID=1491 RepID=UPI001C9A6962|nr:N-acetylmuramoyl-L-alanine amidase [Clostridium botulinum]MBY6788281.1 N-acetylmuramoyl-L-alanine amidase [Clostridium botulinum]MBY6815922.1 N-acetylmuramoyl-L-alanine amidase [Clostridium botulinum]MBY6827823.1 N-acetylmuramoyl-L-alanine amidase [Clostridium botulinum]MBY6859770.1 N-acetylmuramoyl-L-alanine amidase [Clostridium botulinum]MBY6948210.1 N-acetylmuramoyl-L-alanine amidase [Clostridium botulinum]
MVKINTLAIDIGHNINFDGGAVGIRKEDELNKLVGEALINKFKSTTINVINCTPYNAVSLHDSLNQRTVAANKGKADLFISIHHNSGGGRGSEGFCLTGGIAEQVGNSVLNELSKIGFYNRRVKDRRDLFVINQTIMPALLIECAFCDSASDMNGYNHESVANAIFKGICSVFDIYSNKDIVFNENQVYYNVVNGDTLCKIASKFNTTVEKLVDINGIKDKNKIYVGQDIRIK